MTQQKLENLIKLASVKMRADDNAKGTAKYLEHFSWLLFLKVFEQVEDAAALLAEIDQKPFHRCVDGKFRWSEWTKQELTGSPLVRFVTEDLFPHLRGLEGDAQAEKVAELFNAVSVVMKSGYVLAEVIDIVDQVEFHSAEDYHAISVLYERLLSEMGGDASWSGEFYTPRSIVELMVKATDPKLNETVYDPCSGSCGFLVAAYDHMAHAGSTQEQRQQLQRATFHGKEAGELPFLLGTMNMMLHGIEVPDNVRGNTLERDARNLPSDEQYAVILTNPPFGGKENPQVQQNFPIRTAATEVLFLQHIVASLEKTGRAAVVVPDGVLFDDDGAFRAIRRRLLTDCNLHTVLRLPVGSFPNTPHQRLNLLFFDRKGPTKGIWFYEHLVPEHRRHITPARYTKRNPLRRDEFDNVLPWWTKRQPNENAWYVPVEDIDKTTYDLDQTHPDRPPRVEVISPEAIREELDEASGAIRALWEEFEEFTGPFNGHKLEAKTLKELGVQINPENWDPRKEPDEHFSYVDLASVDRGSISVGNPVLGKDAPSRARRVIETDDVLFATVRPNLRGHAVVPAELDGAIASTGFAVLRPPETIDSTYLFLALMSPTVIEQCMAQVRGAHYPALRNDHVNGLRIYAPDRGVQEQVVAELWPKVLHVRKVRQLVQEMLDSLKDGEYSLVAS